MELKTYFAQDASGNIMPGATVMVYEAATTTLATGLQDESGAPLANPFTADSSAKVAFYAPDGLYDITVVGNGRTVTIRAQFVSVDGASVLRSDLAATGGAALVGYGEGTVNDALDALSGASSVINIRDYGAALDGVANDASALLAANAAAVAAKLPLLIPGVAHIGTSTTISAPIVDGLHQMFSVTSSVTINNGLPVRPEWFGSSAGNILRAVNALPAGGGVVKLEDKTYPPSYNIVGTTAGVNYLAKANVRIDGAKTPKPNAGLTALEGGTVIQGPFLVYADGFEIDKVGVDSGSDVCSALYGGTAQEGFVTFKPGQSLVLPSMKNVTIGDLVGLCQSPTAAVHALLLEAIDGLQFTNIRAYNGFHGAVIKSTNVNGANVYAKGNTGEGLILKSDNYAPLGGVNIANVLVESASGSLESGFGVLVEAVTYPGGQVNIANIRAINKGTGLCARSNGQVLSDVNVNSLITDGCTTGYSVSGINRRTKVASAVINNATDAVNVASTVTHDFSNSVAELNATNCVNGINAAGKFSVGYTSGDNISGHLFRHDTVDARILIGTYSTKDVANIWALSQSLSGTWENVPTGNSTFSVLPWSGKVRLTGLVKPGASTTIATLSTQISPSANLRFVALGYNGSVWSPIELVINTAGVVAAVNYTQGSTYISLDGIEYPIPQ